jgi:hypothetical protein
MKIQICIGTAFVAAFIDFRKLEFYWRRNMQKFHKLPNASQALGEAFIYAWDMSLLCVYELDQKSDIVSVTGMANLFGRIRQF